MLNDTLRSIKVVTALDVAIDMLAERSGQSKGEIMRQIQRTLHPVNEEALEKIEPRAPRGFKPQPRSYKRAPNVHIKERYRQAWAAVRCENFCNATIQPIWQLCRMSTFTTLDKLVAHGWCKRPSRGLYCLVPESEWHERTPSNQAKEVL